MSPLRLVQSGLSLVCTVFEATPDADEFLALKVLEMLKIG
jgi:hypothetical protein